MTLRNCFFALLLLIAIDGCAQDRRLNIKIITQTQLDSVPSGSGMVVEKDSVYIIGDDATCIYKLHINSKAYSKIPITGVNGGYRMSKPLKHDYECAETMEYLGKQYLLAMGSGSMSPTRDSMLIMNMATKQQHKISMAPLYDAFRKVSAQGTDINIEGLAIANNHAYILNRSKGYIYKVAVSDLREYIFSSRHAVPKFKTYQIQLPEQKGLIAGLSGGCRLDDDRLLICASLENTPSSTEDGEIRGSYIGILDISSDKEIKLEAIELLKNRKRKNLIEKIESVEYLGKDNGNIIRILAITDNDNGSSKLMELSVEE